MTLLEQTPVSGRIQCGISGERYITPAFDGTHTVGASYNLDSTSAECSSGDHADNIHIINGLTQAGFEQAEQQPGRVAFRAVSRDRVPVVGCVPDSDSFARDYHDLQHGRSARHYPAGTYLPGLYVSTAHGSRGLASCFIAAEIIASMITAEPAPVEKDVLDYLNPARFLVRKLKRGRH